MKLLTSSGPVIGKRYIVGNGKSLVATHTGSTTVYLFEDNMVAFKEVLLVPGLRSNQVSYKRLCEIG